MRISNSQIQCFKACRRMYQLRYIECVSPVEKAECLERGTSYHAKVEALLKDGVLISDEDVKTNAMIRAFDKYIRPQLGTVQRVQEWFSKHISDKSVIIGRCDGVMPNGTLLEHKTTSLQVGDKYIDALENDEQILTYMWAYGVNEMLYTVCRKPTIRIKSSQTQEEFEQRCTEWYDTDTEQKIALIRIYRSDEDILQFDGELRQVCEQIENVHTFYKNPNNCNKWGTKCAYAPICRNYDPTQQYIGFERRVRCET